MDKAKTSEEYGAQLLNYPPSTVTDFLIGTLDSAVTECLEVMEQSLLSSSVFEDVPKEQLINGLGLLKKRFVGKMEPINAKLERFLKEIVFKIPDHVLLPEDTAQRTKHTVKSHRKLLKEIENIKSEIHTEKYKNAILKVKLKEATAYLECFKTAATEMKSVTRNVFKDNDITDVDESAEFLQKKIEELQAQLNHPQVQAPSVNKPVDIDEAYRLKERVDLPKFFQLRN